MFIIDEHDDWCYLDFLRDAQCPDHVQIPVHDDAAYVLNRKHNWVYNKLHICQSQGLFCEPSLIEPSRYPVFVKPIMNLNGMGIDSHVVHSKEELESTYRGGQFWMPYLTGDHISTDIAVINGNPVWMVHTIGHKEDSTIEWNYWEVLNYQILSLVTKLNKWISKYMSTYTGMVNIETIDGIIIEVHLRFSIQFAPLYPEDFLRNVVTLYKNGLWYCEEQKDFGYSVPIFYHTIPDNIHLPRTDGISAFDLSDDSSNYALKKKRLAVVNSYDLNMALEYRSDFLDSLFSS